MSTIFKSFMILQGVKNRGTVSDTFPHANALVFDILEVKAEGIKDGNNKIHLTATDTVS